MVHFSGKNKHINIVVKPYTEVLAEQHGTGKEFIYRTFSVEIEDSELVWHRDKSNRKLHVLNSNGWKLQMEDQLPVELVTGRDYYIHKMTYHRVIKGNNDLVVRIENI